MMPLACRQLVANVMSARTAGAASTHNILQRIFPKYFDHVTENHNVQRPVCCMKYTAKLSLDTHKQEMKQIKVVLKRPTAQRL